MKYISQHLTGKKLAVLAALGLVFLGTAPLSAADKTWVGTTPWWTGGTNWDSVGAPASGDFAYFGDTATGTTVSNGGTTFISRLVFSGSNAFTFNGGGSIQASGDPMIVQDGSGRLTFTSGFIIPFADRRIEGSGSGAILINGNISGNGAFALEGSAQVYFNGTQTSSSSPVFKVSPGATLGGTGTFNSRVDVLNGAGGAHIAPGTPDTIGTLVLANGFRLTDTTNTANFDFTLGGVGNTFDQILVTGGTFTLQNPAGKYVLNISDQGLGASTGVFDLIDWTGATESFAATSDTSFAFGSLPVGWTVDATYGTAGIDFDTTSNILSVKFSTVPEPATSLLTGLGLMFVLIRRRRA